MPPTDPIDEVNDASFPASDPPQWSGAHAGPPGVSRATAFERAAPVFPVRDVTAALEHYRRLGFEVQGYAEPSPAGPIYGFARRGGVELHFTRAPGLDPKASMSACYLYVTDADALYEAWRASGVQGRLTAPVDTPYGLRELAHVDPDGNLLRVGSPSRRTAK